MPQDKTICIIDDDPIYQLVTKKMIDKSGLFHDVYSFTNALDAIHHFKENENLPDAILLDIEMPQMDAWDFLDELITVQPSFQNQKIIYIVSSSIASEDKQKAEHYNCVKNFLSKPVNLEKLQTIAEG
ncbi:response regulator [Flavobacterium pedocola]